LKKSNTSKIKFLTLVAVAVVFHKPGGAEGGLRGGLGDGLGGGEGGGEGGVVEAEGGGGKREAAEDSAGNEEGMVRPNRF
jgi:hypothetical protein